MLRKTPEAISIYRLSQQASMRPQRNAAENQGVPRGESEGGRASMRPQRNAAENGMARILIT